MRPDGTTVRGLSVAVVTPMTPEGEVDFPGLRKHARWLVENGVDVLMPCGTTGEGVTLDPAEQVRVVEECVEAANGRVPVFAGAGSNWTKTAQELARGAAAAGADGLLCATPAYNKPSQEGLYRHFTEVVEAGGGLPVVLYNVPGRTAVNLLPETVFRLARMEPVIGVKEACGDIDQIQTVLRDRPEGFLVLAGDDSFALPVMALGGDGVVSVVGNEAPRLMADLVGHALAGDFTAARKIHERLLPLMRANFIESNPVPAKTALEMMGRMGAQTRLPLVPLKPESREILRRAMVDAGLMEGDADA